MQKVMLVEDDPTMLDLLRRLMEIEGFQVVQVNAGQEPLAEIASEQPDIVLLDVYLEGISGLDVIKDLRADPELAHTRVLMSSGMDYKDACLKAGADDFILKPYMPDELIRRIRELLT